MAGDPQILTELHERLAAKLAELTTGSQWLAWLESSRQFHRYSPQNQMLLALQGAKGHVASYRTWQRIPAKDGGRCQVAKGEHGMVILAPLTVTRRDTDELTGEAVTATVGLRGFKPVKVFHQGQLVSPPELANQPLPQLLTGENRHQHVWRSVETRLVEAGYSVEVVSRSPVEAWNGRTNFVAGTVQISDHLQPPARMKTLVHEWAHVALDHDTRLGDRRDLQEVEAESVAYLVCASFDLDSTDYSIPYIAGWANGDPQQLQATAQTVLATTATLVSALEHELGIDLTPELNSNPHAATTSLVPAVEPSTTASLESASTPFLNRSSGSVHTVMAALANEHDRQGLAHALTDINAHLGEAAGLCADAGLEGAEVFAFLIEHGADPTEAYRTLSAPTADVHGDVAPLFSDIDIARTDPGRVARRANAQEPAVLQRIAGDDRALLGYVDWDHPDQRASAARILVDIGLTASEAGEALAHYGVPDAVITETLQLRAYDPATARLVPLWPGQPPDPNERLASAGERGSESIAAAIIVSRVVAASGDPVRLAALATAMGMDHTTAIETWAAAGIDPGLVAAYAVGQHQGDRAAATNELNATWPYPLRWEAYMPAAQAAPARASGAHAILQSWSAAPAMSQGPQLA